MVTCGDCAVSMDMIKRSDYAHLYAEGTENRWVKNADWGSVTLWLDDDLKMMQPGKLVAF